jgi:hypothetical protein
MRKVSDILERNGEAKIDTNSMLQIEIYTKCRESANLVMNYNTQEKISIPLWMIDEASQNSIDFKRITSKNFYHLIMHDKITNYVFHKWKDKMSIVESNITNINILYSYPTPSLIADVSLKLIYKVLLCPDFFFIIIRYGTKIKNCSGFMRVHRILKVWSLLTTKIIISPK